ncbi:NAD+ synthase [Streptomyces violaceorubidus]
MHHRLPRHDRRVGELVFDGDSIVVDRDGTVLARAPQFTEGCVVLDLDLPVAEPEPPTGVVDDGLRIDRVVLSERPAPEPAAGPWLSGGHAEPLDDDEEVYSALVVGLRAYVTKNGFHSG